MKKESSDWNSESLSEHTLYVGFLTVAIGTMMVWSWVSVETYVVSPNVVSAATSTAVTVSASVTATISCSTNVATTTFGALTSGLVSAASPNASTSMSCANSVAGCTISVRDVGSGSQPGLWNASSSYLIPSPNASFSATSTLLAGTEGYGIQATTTTAGSGATLTVASRYLQAGTTVGGLTTTTVTLASSNATTSNREVMITHQSAVSASTVSGAYADTLTYGCVAN